MKKLIVVLGLVSSMSAMATEFSAKMVNVNCTIKNNVVTRTETFGKEKKASLTEKKEVSLKGMDSLILKAVEMSSQVPAGAMDEYAYSMNHEGKTYTLDTSDSPETMSLIRMITKMCR